ncbi:F-box associated domain containing protein [Tanacetum coccineum]
MSRLDCTTKELIRTTATISKRWINLWTQLPHLIFSNRDDHTYFGNVDTVCDYISFIDNTLNQCPANLNLKRFKLYINYINFPFEEKTKNINYNSGVNSEFKSRANRWIRYAISRNVEDVDLWLQDVGVGQEEFTFEDELFFKTSCITRMTLSYCRFNPPNGAISWERLECLCLYYVTLDEDMIEKILSGSPCLESLELKNCHGYRRIDVTSRSVKNYKGEFEVEPVLLDVSSLIKAELDYGIDLGMSDDITHEEMLRGLLESLDHVKDVIINDFWWEQTLSSGGTDSTIKASCVKEVDHIEKQLMILLICSLASSKMYSLKLGRWKDISDVPHIPSWCRGTFSNRAFHWMVRDTPMSYHRYRLTNIVSLDLANETYGEVSTPPLYGEKCDGGISLRTLGEWLCVIVHYKGIRADLWVMKVYGVKDSWTKLVSIPYYTKVGFSVPVSMSNDGRFLLTSCKKMVVYNSVNHLFTEIHEFDGLFEACTHTDSLVSPISPLDSEQIEELSSYFMWENGSESSLYSRLKARGGTSSGCSLLLKSQLGSVWCGDNRRLMLAKKLLTLHRASPIAEIKVC